MKLKSEDHHKIFYIATIICSFLVDGFLDYLLSTIQSQVILQLIFYLFGMVFITNMGVFLIYLRLGEILLPENYKSIQPVDLKEMPLAASAIMTAFIGHRLIPITDNLLIVLLLIIPIYLVVNKISEVCWSLVG